MKNRIFNFIELLRTSLWFMPFMLMLISMGLAQGTLYFDERFVESIDKNVPAWLFSGGPEAARSILSVLAGSMATVISLVISMTMVTFTLASSEYGPRLLRNFIGDQKNQFVLGVFMAAFVYSISVLRSVRSVEESEFVPKISITVAFILTVFSFILLIYLLHHVAVSLRVETLVANVGDELNSRINHIYPDKIKLKWSDQKPSIPLEMETMEPGQGVPILMTQAGYIQGIDYESLINIAFENDLTIRLLSRAGHFMLPGECAGEIYGDIDKTNPDDELIEKIQRAFSLGKYRTPFQDIEFSIDQLVEVALVALSPGINKTYTAIACIDRLGESMAKLAEREIPPPFHFRKHCLCVVSYRINYDTILDAAFNKIRQNARNNIAVTIQLLNTLAKIAGQAHSLQALEAVEKQCRIIREYNFDRELASTDQQDLENAYSNVQTIIHSVDRKKLYDMTASGVRQA